MIFLYQPIMPLFSVAPGCTLSSVRWPTQRSAYLTAAQVHEPQSGIDFFYMAEALKVISKEVRGMHTRCCR